MQKIDNIFAFYKRIIDKYNRDNEQAIRNKGEKCYGKRLRSNS